MKLRELQILMRELYGERDAQRGVEKTFMWVTEELGELGRAIRTNDREGMKEEMADVLAWLISLGNLLNVDVEEAFASKYGGRCPRCGRIPCKCPLL